MTQRALTTLSVVLAIAAGGWLALEPVVAQQPPFIGTAPAPGDVGLLVTGAGSSDTTALQSSLTASGCQPEALAVLEAGAWLIFIPGAPAPVNQAFPSSLDATTPFFVRCSDSSPPAQPTPAVTVTASTTPTPTPTAMPPATTYPQPGAPTDIGVSGDVTPFSDTEFRVKIGLTGISSGVATAGGFLTSLRFCVPDAAEKCVAVAPPPGATKSGGSLSAEYLLSVPSANRKGRVTMQLCNVAGCGGFYRVGVVIHHRSEWGEFYALATPFTTGTQTSVYILDANVVRVVVRLSDGTEWESGCSGIHRCGPVQFSSSKADSVTITTNRLDPSQTASATVDVR